MYVVTLYNKLLLQNTTFLSSYELKAHYVVLDKKFKLRILIFTILIRE